MTTETRDEKLDSILSQLGFDPKQPDTLASMLRLRLSKVSDYTLDLVSPVAAMTATEGKQYKFLYSVVDHREEEQTREILFFHPLTKNLDIVMLKLFINGLRQIDYFRFVTTMDTLQGRALDVAVAFMKVSAALNLYVQDQGLNSYSDENNYLYVESKDLQDLIIEYPEKADELAAYIAERRVWSAVVLREFVENAAGLRTGVL